MLCSCSKQENDSLIVEQSSSLDLDSELYANSNVGIYNGIFTTTSGSERGSLGLTIPADGETLASALLSLDNGETIMLQATTPIVPDTKVIEVLFTSNIASFNYGVEANGTLPTITNVQMNGLEGAIRIGKHTNRAPVTPYHRYVYLYRMWNAPCFKQFC